MKPTHEIREGKRVLLSPVKAKLTQVLVLRDIADHRNRLPSERAYFVQRLRQCCQRFEQLPHNLR
jgi:hypothetical protein